MTRPPRQAGVILAMAAVLVPGLVGCAGEPEVELPDARSPRPAGDRLPTPSDPVEAEATEEILTLVREFREVEVASYANPQPPHLASRELAGYLADPLLLRTLETLDDMYQAGIVFEGRPTWEPVVTDLRLDETPPTATVRDCVDATNWRSVFEETGDPVPGDDQPNRYVAWLQVKQYPDGWLAYQIDVEEGAQC